MTKNGGVSVCDYRQKSNNSNCWRLRPVCADAVFDGYYQLQKPRGIELIPFFP
ncbi:hypothetical protein LMBIIBHN_02853 [Aeromonas salmonicida]